MPAPTRAQLISRLQKACKLPWTVLQDATDRYEALLDEILEGAPTTLSAVSNSAAETFLRRVAGLLGTSAEIVGPELQAMAEELTGFAATSPAAAISALYAYFVEDKPIRVRSRGITFGTPTAEAGNSFDGVLQRQTVDEEGFALEAVTIERKVWECVSDARTGDGGDRQGRPHEEFWVCRGENPNRYGIEETGSGANSRPRTKSALQDNVLFNQVFASATFSGSAPSASSPAAPTAIAGWTAETISKITLSVDSLPRTYKDNPTVYKAVFGTSGGTADNYLTQTATTWQKVTSDSRCYHAEVWVRRLSSADGTLTIQLGSKSATINVGTQLVNGDWTRVRLSDGTDNKGWPRAWNSTTAAFTVDLSGNTTGTIEVCYPMVVALDLINGSLWGMMPGEAEAKVGDEISVTDTLAGSDSVINQILVRLFRRYLPHCDDSAAFIAGAQTVQFAASGRTITRSAGSWVTDGWQAGMGASIQSPLNNTATPKLVASVSALVLTLDSDETLVDEGPLAAGAIVAGGPYIEDP